MAPDYIAPLLHTPGLFALVGAGIAVGVGITVILRMVRMDI
jgi:Flp pilus assembly protein TadB